MYTYIDMFWGDGPKDNEGTWHLIQTQEGLFGVIDDAGNEIIAPAYFTIYQYHAVDRTKANWARRQGKAFLILENTQKQWAIFNVKGRRFLDVQFVSAKRVNTTPLFVDANELVWVLDEHADTPVPCSYDTINHAFRHKELNPKVDVVYKKYADTYFDRFVGQFVHDEQEKRQIRHICYMSIDDPEAIIDTHIDGCFESDADDQVIMLCQYVEKLIAHRHPKPTKKSKELLCRAYYYEMQALYFVEKYAESIETARKLIPMVHLLSNRMQYVTYQFLFNSILEIDAPYHDEELLEFKNMYARLTKKEQKEVETRYAFLLTTLLKKPL